MSSAKWRPFCLGLNLLSAYPVYTYVRTKLAVSITHPRMERFISLIYMKTLLKSDESVFWSAGVDVL